MSPSGFEEDLNKEDFKSSQEYVLRTGECKLEDKLNELLKKKEANADGYGPVHIVICADTIISLDDKKVFEKPDRAGEEDKAKSAFEMIRELSDRKEHQVYTAVWVSMLDPETQKEVSRKGFVNATTVTLANLTDEEIKAYVATGEPYGKAGGYGIQGGAATFVTGINGCFYNVWGFPLAQFV